METQIWLKTWEIQLIKVEVDFSAYPKKPTLGCCLIHKSLLIVLKSTLTYCESIWDIIGKPNRVTFKAERENAFACNIDKIFEIEIGPWKNIVILCGKKCLASLEGSKRDSWRIKACWLQAKWSWWWIVEVQKQLRRTEHILKHCKKIKMKKIFQNMIWQRKKQENHWLRQNSMHMKVYIRNGYQRERERDLYVNCLGQEKKPLRDIRCIKREDNGILGEDETKERWKN